MGAEVYFIFSIRFFLSSIIFIISAYFLQRLIDARKYNSTIIKSTKNAFTILSIMSLFAFAVLSVMTSQ